MSSSANDPSRSVSTPSSSCNKQDGSRPSSLGPPSFSSSAPAAVGYSNVATTTASPSFSSSCYHDQDATRLTCDVLCSLSHQCVELTTTAPAARDDAAIAAIAAAVPLPVASSLPSTTTSSTVTTSCPSNAAVAKQHQLPMFLSKTYHMIDRCDPEISTWSDNGESFVVKNVEQFANNVLPLYFKHSNFSSFARQLNFYGFRKLRTDPILTQDVDPRTSAYIRFYHDKFQKDKPELLQHIRRATKTDQQSRDDLDYLKQEISRLQETNADMKQDFDLRIAELSYECNRRVTALNADYDKLYSLVQTFIASSSSSGTTAAVAVTANGNGIQQQQQQLHHLPAAPAPPPPPPLSAPLPNHSDATAVALAALRDLPNTRRTVMPDLLHSLSHAATAGLQNMVHADKMLPAAASHQHQQQQQQQHAISPSSASHVHYNNNNNVVVTDSSSSEYSTNSKQDYVLEV